MLLRLQQISNVKSAAFRSKFRASLVVLTGLATFLPSNAQVPGSTPDASNLTYSVIYRASSPVTAAQGPLAAFKSRSGVLYATSAQGGNGNGSVISLSQPTPGGPWVTTTIYSFVGGVDGSSPNVGLVAAPDGNLYGTTFTGGPGGSGVVFRLLPPDVPGNDWTEQTIYGFDRSQGGLPMGYLAMGPTGKLYGLIAGDLTGANPMAVFQLTPPASSGAPWIESRIYKFAPRASFSGGLTPVSDNLVICSDGFTLFALNIPAAAPENTVATTLFDLSAANLASNAPPAVLPSGVILLPTTGGTQYGQITSFLPSQVPGAPWTPTSLYTFGNTDGAFPQGQLLLQPGGVILGTTWAGGSRGNGTVYRLNPPAGSGQPWTVKVLHSFAGGQAGELPETGVVLSGGAIYGIAMVSGNNLSTVGFQLAANTN